MDTPFSYDTIAAGQNIIGRSAEIDQMTSALEKDGRHVTMIGPPRSGKETVVRESIERFRQHRHKFHLCEIDLFNTRSYSDFADVFRKKMKECFNQVNAGSVLPFEIDINAIPDKKLIDLPEIIAGEAQTELVIYFKEFQNIAFAESEEFQLDKVDKTWSKQKHVKYILTGSCVNMMKTLTEERKLFYYSAAQIDLQPIDKKLVCQFITSNFMRLGRIIEIEEAMKIWEITSGNMWYVKQLCAICHGMPIGYVNRKNVNMAAETLISTHTPRFKQTMLDLTANQISFIKAVIDGVEKFSSADIMEAYRLNSSANVFRIKDALKKKEVMTFDREDKAIILDPLFEYWLRYYYFA